MTNCKKVGTEKSNIKFACNVFVQYNMGESFQDYS